MTKEELNTQIDTWASQYKSLYVKAEEGVVDWKWCKKQYFTVEPFFFEKQNKRPAKLLKVVPADTAGYVQCGFDSGNQVLIEKEIQSHPGHGWDRIYLYESGKCIWELAFSKDGEIQYGRYNHWIGDRLSYYHHKHFFGDVRYFREEYLYEEDRVRSSTLSVIYPDRGDQSTYQYTYIYDDHIILQSITANISHSYSKGYQGLSIYKRK